MGERIGQAFELLSQRLQVRSSMTPQSCMSPRGPQMNGSNRRVFMLQMAASGSALLAATAQAQTAAMVNEKDPTAVALGYTADATKVDAKKYPKYAAGQKCGNCQLYTGKAGDPAGGCGIFPGKMVGANAWCSAYVKKT
jgi:hypothetical protein